MLFLNPKWYKNTLHSDLNNITKYNNYINLGGEFYDK